MRCLPFAILLLALAACASNPAERRETRARTEAQNQSRFETTLAEACRGVIVIETNEVPHSEAISVLAADRLAKRGCRVTQDRAGATHALRLVGFYESEGPWRGQHILADLGNLAWYQYQKTLGEAAPMTIAHVETALRTPSIIAFAMRGSGVYPRHFTYDDVVAQPIVADQSVTLHGILARAKDPDSQHPIASWRVKTTDSKGPQFDLLPRLDRALEGLLASQPLLDQPIPTR